MMTSGATALAIMIMIVDNDNRYVSNDIDGCQLTLKASPEGCLLEGV